MKYFSAIIIVYTLVISPACFGQMACGCIERIEVDTNTTTRSELSFYGDRQTYTTGGLTFTHPSNLFTQAPNIQVSVQPNAPHPTTETYVAEISASSNTDCVITVYKVTTSGVVNEAPNLSVTVHIFAIDAPL